MIPNRCVLGSQNQFLISEKLFFLNTCSPHLYTFFQDFFCLGPMDCAVNNLFISPDAKGSDSVSGFVEHRGLACELRQHLGCWGQSVSTFPHTDVEAELADAKFPYGVLLFTLILCHDVRGAQKQPFIKWWWKREWEKWALWSGLLMKTQEATQVGVHIWWVWTTWPQGKLIEKKKTNNLALIYRWACTIL